MIGNQINLKQLEAFVVAAEQGSFSEAAAVIGTTQSNVSSTISNLEDRLGVRLFDRTRRQSTTLMTKHGEQLIKRARVALLAAEVFVAEAKNLNSSSVEGQKCERACS